MLFSPVRSNVSNGARFRPITQLQSLVVGMADRLFKQDDTYESLGLGNSWGGCKSSGGSQMQTIGGRAASLQTVICKPLYHVI